MSEFEIRLSGTGGQGLILAGLILSESVLREGKWAAQSQSFEPVSRGGVSRADLVISDEMVDYPLVTALDFLLVVDQIAAEDSLEMMKPEGMVLVDSDHVQAPPQGAFRLFSLPVVESARSLGNLRATNMVALGAIVALTGICRTESLEHAIRSRSPRGFEEINLTAMKKGYELAASAVHQGAARTTVRLDHPRHRVGPY